MFKEADVEFDTGVKRRGEAIELFAGNVPTYSYFPAVYYDQGRALQGMENLAFADSYKSYLAIREQSAEDPLAAKILKQMWP